MGWLIFLAIVIILNILPMGVRIRYDKDGFTAKLVLGFVRLTVYPLPKWLKFPKKKTPEAAPKPEQPKQEQPKAEQPKQEEPKKKGGSWTDFLPFVQLGLSFLGDFRRKFRLNHLILKINLANADPYTLALTYGNTWAAVGNLLPRLERLFVIKKRDIDVTCDFTAEETTVIAQLEITITLGRIAALLAVYAVRGLKTFLTFKKKRNGGAEA